MSQIHDKSTRVRDGEPYPGFELFFVNLPVERAAAAAAAVRLPLATRGFDILDRKLVDGEACGLPAVCRRHARVLVLATADFSPRPAGFAGRTVNHRVFKAAAAVGRALRVMDARVATGAGADATRTLLEALWDEDARLGLQRRLRDEWQAFTPENVVTTLAGQRTRTRVDVVKIADGRTLVCKTFRRSAARFFEREVAARRLLQDMPEIVPVLMTGAHAVFMPYVQGGWRWRDRRGNLYPVERAKQCMAFLQRLHARGFALVDAHPDAFLFDAGGLKVIDLEYLAKQAPDVPFARSVDIAGPPPGFNGDLPAGKACTYAVAWYPVVGLSLEDLLLGSPLRQTVKRALFRLLRRWPGMLRRACRSLLRSVGALLPVGRRPQRDGAFIVHWPRPWGARSRRDGGRRLEDLIAKPARILVAGSDDARLLAWLSAQGSSYDRFLSPHLGPALGSQVRPWKGIGQVRLNNASVLVLDGPATEALRAHRNIRHASVVAVPLGLPLLRPRALAGLVRYAGRKLTFAGSGATGGRRWLVWRVVRARGTGERVFVPDTWGLGGFVERLNRQGLDYVLLRWWDRLPDWPAGEDADFLATDEHALAIRAMLENQLGTIPVDLYSVSGGESSGGDGMACYPPECARRILDHAVTGPYGCRIPAPREAFFSLAYHAIYHKGLLSGIATDQALRPSAAPVHPFARLLQTQGEALGFGQDETATMEKVDALLHRHGWRPPADTLSRLAHRNPWIAQHVFASRPKHPAGLAAFVLREAAERWGIVEELAADLQARGFVLLRRCDIPSADRPAVAGKLRGGNWSPGPWPAPGGRPAVVLAMADTSPMPMPGRGKKRRQYPRLDNARLLIKNALREDYNRKRAAGSAANFLHVSDNTSEALDYLGAVLPPAEVQSLYRTFIEMRGLEDRPDA